MDNQVESLICSLYQKTLDSILSKKHFYRKDLAKEVYYIACLLSIKDCKIMQEAVTRIDNYFEQQREKIFTRRLYGESTTTRLEDGGLKKA